MHGIRWVVGCGLCVVGCWLWVVVARRSHGAHTLSVVPGDRAMYLVGHCLQQGHGGMSCTRVTAVTSRCRTAAVWV